MAAAMIAGERRIVLLDAVRGLAVLGILLCNMPDFDMPLGVSESVRLWPQGREPASLAVWALTQIVFQRKFVTLFSMMFGVSLFLVGGETSDRARTGVLLRRLGWLLAIGVLHGFAVWWGDILFDYAAVGFAVMWARSWPAKRLLWVGGVLFGLMSVLMWAGGLAQLAFAAPTAQKVAKGDVKALAEAATAIAAYRGSFVDSLAANFRMRASILPNEPFFLPIGGGLMMIGLGLHKLGVFTGQAPRAAYRAFLGAGAASLFVLAAAAGCVLVYVGTPDLGARYVANFLFSSFQNTFAVFISLSYLSLLYFALDSRVFAVVPRVLAPVGQMAFTNYLTQSLMMTAVFYGGRGLGLYGRLDRPALLAITVVVWVLQIAWSNWWLRRFESGPFEWAWRRLYRGPSRLRRPMPPPEVVPA